MKFVRALAQLLLYLPLMALLGYFSTQPAFTHLAPDKALVRMSFSHAGELKEKCRQRSAEELAKLPPNMRAAQDCPRERSAVTIELDLDGEMIFATSVAPTGLRRDGASTLYRRLVVPSGRHQIVARLRDRPGAAFNYRAEVALDLAPGGALLIDFNPTQGGFVFRR
jgi:hypothetical protein